jgi:hypothetical protein
MKLVCVDAHPAVDKGLCSLVVRDFTGLDPATL